MPRYWFTQHWPHPIDPADDCEWFIYLKHEYKNKGDRIRDGDKVVFYETGKGKAHRRKGTSELVRLKKGRQAVVGIAEVCGPIRISTTGQNVKQYEGERTMNWAWEVPCDKHRWGKEVPSADVLRILGRDSMRIRGGLLEIAQAQFEEFKRRLKV